MDAARQPGVNVVLDDADVSRAIKRIAHEIVEKARGSRSVVLLGIPTRGVQLAHRIAAAIDAIEATGPEGDETPPVPVGSLDITLYRDDLRLRPARALEETSIPVEGIDGKTVVLVDDVLYSGRTVRAALDALSDLGRPAAVRLAVLVDRGHRELPIRPDYVGKNLPTSASEQVRVQLADPDGVDQVSIEVAALEPASAGTADGSMR